MNRQLLTTLILALSIVSCSQKGQQALLQDSTQANSFDEKAKSEPRKTTYNAAIEVAVEEPDTLANRLIKKIVAQGGSLQSRQNLRLNFKVNPSQLESLFEEIKQLGNVKSEYLGSEDVTDAFYDTEARLENLKKVRARYLNLLEKAQNVQDVLSVEKELERINGDIDVLQGRLNRIQGQVNQADLIVTLKQQQKAGVLGAIGKGIYSGIKWLFVRG